MAIKVSGTTVIDDSRRFYNAANVGINTNSLTDPNLVGAGNSFTGLYICQGMVVMDNTFSGNAYIGTAYNGLMAGPVTVTGTITVNGNLAIV